MNVIIEDKGNSTFKLTITSEGDVRIKVQEDATDEARETMIKRFKHIAQDAIRGRLNITTLRGKCTVDDETITLYTDSKKVVSKYQF